MSQRTHTDGRDSATESKFYLPAGTTQQFVTDRVEAIWATLFNHGIETPK